MLLLLACVATDTAGGPSDSDDSSPIDTDDTGDTADSGEPGPLPYVEREGATLVADGEVFRFIGFNTRGITHYGAGDILPASSADDVALTLDTVQAIGGTVVRVFAANDQVTPDVAAERLATLLDEAERRRMYVIVVLADALDTGFVPEGDDAWYAEDDLGTLVLGPEWYAGGYIESYLPWVEAAVTRNAGHRALLAWELANEPRNPTNQEAFLTWVEATTDTIRAIDDRTLVTAGLMSTSAAGLNTDQIKRLYEGLDLFTIHTYDETGSSDLSVVLTMEIPLVVDAAGFSGDARANKTTWNAEQLVAAGAEGYMQWGLMATETDNGDGDDRIGMDRVYYDDWDALVAAYTALVGRL